MKGLRDHLPLSGHRDADDERGRRSALVMEIVDRFVFDLGLLVSGSTVDLDGYVAPGPASRLRDAAQPGLGGTLTTQPDFGEYAQVRIEGDLLDVTAPVRAVVEFEDRSTRVDHQGRAVARIRRRVRLLLLLDPGIARVIDHRVEID